MTRSGWGPTVRNYINWLIKYIMTTVPTRFKTAIAETIENITKATSALQALLEEEKTS